MFYFLYNMLYDSESAFSFIRAFSYITVRSGFALITAILISIIFGKKFIHKLIEMKMGQPIREDHFHNMNETKKNTPTMGGILILFSVTVSVLLWGNLTNKYVILLLVSFLALGFVGFIDDYKKLKYKNSEGLSGKKKLLLQIIIALLIGLFLYKNGIVTAKLWDRTVEITSTTYKTFLTAEYTDLLTVPFFKNYFFNLKWFYVIFVILVIVGTSNAVNLTDGLDGLASGTIGFTLVTFTVITYITGNWQISKYLQILFVQGSAEITVFCAALIGSILGFLWYNSHPAQVFMGDIGSLSIGGVIGVIAIIVKHELLLIVAGGIFVMEALSVILQVMSFKVRKKRIFKMAPIHHHFELSGISESKVIIRFWIVSIILMLLSLSTLKLR